jgi:predicted AAA+ superfamily ATPase
MLNASKKFQYSKVASAARSRSHATAWDWLVAADMVLPCTAVSRAEVPLQANIDADTFKLYLSDIGFLVSLTNLEFADIMTNQSFSFKGPLAENYVACELVSSERNLFYWRSDNRAEVDFLLENSLLQGGVIPVEVKADKYVQAPSLSVYERKYAPSYSICISTKNFGAVNRIKSVPLYAVFCMRTLL